MAHSFITVAKTDDLTQTDTVNLDLIQVAKYRKPDPKTDRKASLALYFGPNEHYYLYGPAAELVNARIQVASAQLGALADALARDALARDALARDALARDALADTEAE